MISTLTRAIRAAPEDETQVRETVLDELKKANLVAEEIEASGNFLTEKIANIEARRDGLAKRIDELNERRDHLSSRSAEISAQKLELESNSPNTAELTNAEAALALQQNNLLDSRDRLHKAETARAENEKNSRQAVKALQKARSIVTELE